MAQHRAQTAEQRASSTLSGVKAVANQTCHAQYVVKAAIAEARLVCDEVLAKIAAFGNVWMIARAAQWEC